MKTINDCPLILHLQLILVKETEEFFSDLRAVWVKQKKSSIVMKVSTTKSNSDFKKSFNVSIPGRNLR